LSAAVEARGLEKRFGAVRALRPLDLEVPAGGSLAVLGPNGAGKSTLLRLLAGLARPSGGTLCVAGAGDRIAHRRSVGFVGHATFLYPALTARENVILAARLHGVDAPAQRADAALAEVDLGALAERRAGTLSRGAAQRLAIARALVHDPPLLLLDEPFSGLDPRAAERLAERLARLHAEGRSLVLVTHDLARAALLADAAIVLAAGRAFAVPRGASRDAARLERAWRDFTAEGAPH
jgi:heme exporter protein A